VLDVSHGRLARALLASLPAEHESQLLQHLSHKDQVEVQKTLSGLGVDRELALAIIALPELQGGPEVLDRAATMPGFERAKNELQAVRDVVERIVAAGLGSELVVDLGETSPTPYYTGVMFQVLAEGPGQAVASGGRYDELYSRFGIEREAAGAAINIDHLRWALGTLAERPIARILVATDKAPSAGREQETAVSALRAKGRPAVAFRDPVVRGTASFAALVEYAKMANFSHIAHLSGEEAPGETQIAKGTPTVSAFRVEAHGVRELAVGSIEDLLALVPGSV
jgi:ATP phosphoribosyltransferase regulatory subunit